MDTIAPPSSVTPALRAFARRLADSHAASHVYLFGERLSDPEDDQADFEFIIVSPRFTGSRPWERGYDVRAQLYATGTIAPAQLICLTPDEFADVQQRVSLVAAVLPDAIDLLAPEPAVQDQAQDAANGG